MGAMVEDGEAERLNQFALPHGALGRVVGWLMAAINSDMERCAVDALGLHGTESALEIGFGPGVGVARLARRLPDGRVAGIDASVVMLTQASRRNRRAIREGRVELRDGTASLLPWNDGCFDAVVSVNNIQEWPNLSSDLAEIRRVLTPRGRCRSRSTRGSTSTPKIAASRTDLGANISPPRSNRLGSPTSSCVTAGRSRAALCIWSPTSLHNATPRSTADRLSLVPDAVSSIAG